MEGPLISIIIVNYNGCKFLQACLQSIIVQDYINKEIIVVDNGSTDNSVEFIEEYFPTVILLKNKFNRGFAGGNNDGITICKGEFVAFLNNDTKVKSDWLSKLYCAISNKGVTAVGSKILFYEAFVEIEFRMETFNPKLIGESDDNRELSCMLLADPFFKECSYPKVRYIDGCYDKESSGDKEYRWLDSNAKVFIPIKKIKRGSYRLVLNMWKNSLPKKPIVKIYVADEEVGCLSLTDSLIQYEINISKELVDRNSFFILNNAGSEFNPISGYGRDRGFNEIDNGQYNKMEEVDALCGCSFLIKKSVIDVHGGFDPDFFAYYEDTDLFWRLKRKAKGRFKYVPDSVVYHYHTGTSEEWSPFFRFHVERNRLLMVLKNGSFLIALKEFIGYLAAVLFLKNLTKDTRRIRINVIMSYLKLFPKMLFRGL